jgi:hypothetical protein
MLAIEPAVRHFCASRLDELVGSGSFDFVTEFAQFVPMRVFCRPGKGSSHWPPSR